jgi:hypothetical protein
MVKVECKKPAMLAYVNPTEIAAVSVDSEAVRYARNELSFIRNLSFRSRVVMKSGEHHYSDKDAAETVAEIEAAANA